MNPKDQPIITEDGQRLSIQDGAITGTEDTGPGLAYQTGNTLDEPAASTDENAETDTPDE